MKKFLTLIIAGIILLLPTRASAVAYHSYGVTSEEKELAAIQEVETRSFFEELEYRMLEKDENYDTTDYTILAVIIILILIVIVELNKKTYIVKTGTVFEEPEVNEEETFEVQEDNKNIESNTEDIVNQEENTEDKISEEVSNN